MFVNFVPLGESLVFGHITEDSDGDPVDADDTPSYDIYDSDFSAKLVTAGDMATITATTGCYYVSEAITAAKGFSAGNSYNLLASWEISAAAKKKQYSFRVI